MSRILFVVPPFSGHVYPTVAIGAELVARGHQVAWAGDGAVLARLLGPGHRFYATGRTSDSEAGAVLHARWLGLRGMAALKFLWEDVLVPLGRSMLTDVEAAVRAFEPDLIVADQQALAGSATALRLGITWATSVTTPGELTRPLALTPKVEDWVRQQIAGFARQAGLAPHVAGRVDLRFSEHLVLAYTTAALLGPVELGPQVVLVGPAMGSRPGAEFPWSWLDPDRAHVLVSLGTVNQQAGRRFYQVAGEALAPLENRLQAVVVAEDGLLAPVPANVIVRAFVPQVELLAHMDAVVCHGGPNTVVEALFHGLPLVVAPIRDEQSIVATQVERAAGGVRVSFGRVKAPQLAQAVLAVLDQPSYRQRAQELAASLAAAGGAAAAAGHLIRLAEAGPAGRPAAPGAGQPAR